MFGKVIKSLRAAQWMALIKNVLLATKFCHVFISPKRMCAEEFFLLIKAIPNNVPSRFINPQSLTLRIRHTHPGFPETHEMSGKVNTSIFESLMGLETWDLDPHKDCSVNDAKFHVSKIY